jgi:hypothetical protein
MILSLVTLTFLVLDQFNPTIFGKPFFHVELLIYGIVGIVFSFGAIVRSRKKKPRRNDQGESQRSQSYRGR